jgi:hypothetical protein
MSVSDMFKKFLENIKVERSAQFSQRYGEITKSLNLKFRDIDSTTANSLQVGSYGRYTGIKGISDLDMVYIMPASKWDDYKDNKQSKLLTDVKDAIKARYPSTEVKVDRLVVAIKYQNFHVEVQPVFNYYDSNDDESGYFKYPDTKNGGSWKNTKPRQEMAAVKDVNEGKNKNLRLLCKMARAWKNKHGVGVGGLLIDTLAYNFMKSTDYYDDKSYLHFDYLSRDFFKFLADEPDKDHYKAPGSNQNVKVKMKFQKQASDAYEKSVEAIKLDGKDSANKKWRNVYGSNFPVAQIVKESVSKALATWRNTEEFIEDKFSVDIKYNIQIDCSVHQNQGLPKSLRIMLANSFGISNNKKLIFKIQHHDIEGDFSVKWKILNKGAEAEKRDCIRGEIDNPNYEITSRKETADFKGVHMLECYAIQDGVVVARDQIQVPIL